MENHRFARIVPILLLTFIPIASPAISQEKRVEINPFFGYSFSDGVSVDPIAIGGQIYDAVNAKSGFDYGFHAGVFVTENAEVGFLWNRQESKLEGEGTTTTEFADMPIYNYHGVFTYNFGESDAQARPFVFGGVGATQYKPEDVNGVSVSSETKFSSTWGGGVKVYPNPSVGFSAMARFTPTYIKSDPAGIWCGFYGCYVLADTQYANQFEFSGGLSLRF
ncbi:MAG: outer membrane beta-barrel protein [Vicinamibacteria bacterium]